MEIIECEFEYDKFRKNELYYPCEEILESVVKSEKIYLSYVTLNLFIGKKQKIVFFSDYVTESFS